MVRYNSDNIYLSYVLTTYDENNVILQLPRDTLLLFTLIDFMMLLVQMHSNHL